MAAGRKKPAVVILWSDTGAEEALRSTTKFLKEKIRPFATDVDPTNEWAENAFQWGQPQKLLLGAPKAVEDSDLVLFIFSPELCRNHQKLPTQLLQLAITLGCTIFFLLYNTTEYQLRALVPSIFLSYYPSFSLNSAKAAQLERTLNGIVMKVERCVSRREASLFSRSRHDLYTKAFGQPGYFQRCLKASKCSVRFVDVTGDLCLKCIRTLKRALSDFCIKAYCDGKTAGPFAYHDHKEAVELFKSNLNCVQLHQFLKDKGHPKQSEIVANQSKLFHRVDEITSNETQLAVIEPVCELLRVISELVKVSTFDSALCLLDDQLEKTLQARDYREAIDVLLGNLRNELRLALGQAESSTSTLEELVRLATNETNCLSLELASFLRLCMLPKVVSSVEENRKEEEKVDLCSLSEVEWGKNLTFLCRRYDFGELFLYLQDIRSSM